MGEDIETIESKRPKYLSKMISGFFTGLGFSIAMVIILVLAGYILDHFEEEEVEVVKEDSFMSSLEDRFPSFVEFDEDSGLVILNHEFQQNDNKLTSTSYIKKFMGRPMVV